MSELFKPAPKNSVQAGVVAAPEGFKTDAQKAADADVLSAYNQSRKKTILDAQASPGRDATILTKPKRDSVL